MSTRIIAAWLVHTFDSQKSITTLTFVFDRLFQQPKRSTVFFLKHLIVKVFFQVRGRPKRSTVFFLKHLIVKVFFQVRGRPLRHYT